MKIPIERLKELQKENAKNLNFQDKFLYSKEFGFILEEYIFLLENINSNYKRQNRKSQEELQEKYEEGYDAGWQEGHSEGEKEGYKKGYDEGRGEDYGD